MRRTLLASSGASPPAACAGVQSPLAPRGDQTNALHGLLVLMIGVTGVIYLLVLGGLAWALLRWGAAGDVPTDDRPLGRGLVAATAIIVAGLTVLIVGSFLADRALFASRHDRAMEVRVTGHQWWWRIQYRDPATGRWIESANELHLPRDAPARCSPVTCYCRTHSAPPSLFTATGRI